MEKDIKQAMNLKSQNIADAQRRKNTSIQQAGLQRDATILAAARMQATTPSNLDVQQANFNWTREQVEQEWEYWHNFLNNKLTEQELGF